MTYPPAGGQYGWQPYPQQPQSPQGYPPPGQYDQPGYPPQQPAYGQPTSSGAYPASGGVYPTVGGAYFGQVAQPGYPGESYGYPQPPTRKKTGLIIAIVVVAVVLLAGGIFGAVSLLGGGGSTPVDAMKGFASALEAGDFDKLNSYLCADQKIDKDGSDFKQFKEMFGSGDIHIKVSDIKEVSNSGDSAVVSYTVSVSGSFHGQEINETQSDKAEMVKENGSWKVCHDL